jgi:hypothetical protein
VATTLPLQDDPFAALRPASTGQKQTSARGTALATQGKPQAARLATVVTPTTTPTTQPAQSGNSLSSRAYRRGSLIDIET